MCTYDFVNNIIESISNFCILCPPCTYLKQLEIIFKIISPKKLKSENRMEWPTKKQWLRHQPKIVRPVFKKTVRSSWRNSWFLCPVTLTLMKIEPDFQSLIIPVQMFTFCGSYVCTSRIQCGFFAAEHLQFCRFTSLFKVNVESSQKIIISLYIIYITFRSVRFICLQLLSVNLIIIFDSWTYCCL